MNHETHKPSPETLELARLAVERNEAEKAKLAAMTHEEREAYIHAWSKGLAEQSVAIGERGVGCACCDPDVKAKIKAQEEKKMQGPQLQRAVKDEVRLTCQCGAVLYASRKQPAFSAITCNTCKVTSKVDRPQLKKPAPPAEVVPAEPVKFKA
jgi:hypothetical protein